MLILRNKCFAEEESQQLELGRMRLQSQEMRNQAISEKIAADRERDKVRGIQQAQRIKHKQNEQILDNQVKVKKIEQNNFIKNLGLLRKRPVFNLKPVPMK